MTSHDPLVIRWYHWPGYRLSVSAFTALKPPHGRTVHADHLRAEKYRVLSTSAQSNNSSARQQLTQIQALRDWLLRLGLGDLSVYRKATREILWPTRLFRKLKAAPYSHIDNAPLQRDQLNVGGLRPAVTRAERCDKMELVIMPADSGTRRTTAKSHCPVQQKWRTLLVSTATHLHKSEECGILDEQDRSGHVMKGQMIGLIVWSIANPLA